MTHRFCTLVVELPVDDVIADGATPGAGDVGGGARSDDRLRDAIPGRLQGNVVVVGDWVSARQISNVCDG